MVWACSSLIALSSGVFLLASYKQYSLGELRALSFATTISEPFDDHKRRLLYPRLLYQQFLYWSTCQTDFWIVVRCHLPKFWWWTHAETYCHIFSIDDVKMMAHCSTRFLTYADLLLQSYTEPYLYQKIPICSTPEMWLCGMSFGFEARGIRDWCEKSLMHIL